MIALPQRCRMPFPEAKHHKGAWALPWHGEQPPRNQQLPISLRHGTGEAAGRSARGCLGFCSDRPRGAVSCVWGRRAERNRAGAELSRVFGIVPAFYRQKGNDKCG